MQYIEMCTVDGLTKLQHILKTTMAFKYSNVGDGGCHLARDSYAPCYHQNEGHGWTFGNKDSKPF